MGQTRNSNAAGPETCEISIVGVLIDHFKVSSPCMDGSSRDTKSCSKCMGNCSNLNPYNSAIIHQILIKNNYL